SYVELRSLLLAGIVEGPVGCPSGFCRPAPVGPSATGLRARAPGCQVHVGPPSAPGRPGEGRACPRLGFWPACRLPGASFMSLSSRFAPWPRLSPPLPAPRCTAGRSIPGGAAGRNLPHCTATLATHTHLV